MDNKIFRTKYQALRAYLDGVTVYFADSEADQYPAFFRRHEEMKTAEAEKWFNALVERFTADLARYGKNEKVLFFIVDNAAE